MDDQVDTSSASTVAPRLRREEDGVALAFETRYRLAPLRRGKLGGAKVRDGWSVAGTARFWELHTQGSGAS